MADTQDGTLLVRCKCGNPMRVSKQFVGKQMTCYACGKAFVVGGAAPQPAAAVRAIAAASTVIHRHRPPISVPFATSRAL